jgi:hypothetical protein
MSDHVPTLADKMLAGHERTFTVNFMGKTYPQWKLVEHLARIQGKNDQDMPFHYNYQQCLLYLAKCKMKEEGRQVRINNLKARQIGFTTDTVVNDGIFALFTPNVRVGIIADTLDHAAGIFEKVQYLYDHLDVANPNRDLIEKDPKTYGYLSFKPRLRYNKGQSFLETYYGNSRIEVMCVSDTAGRSKHYTRLHCSEVAFWQGMEKTFTSLFKTVSRSNPNSEIVLETTANGFNDYKMRWDADYAGDTSFQAFFAPWYENPEYRQAIPEGYDLQSSMDGWEREKQEKHHLSDEQMYWFHLEYLDSNRNKQAVLQEDPFDPVDAFVSAGNSVFDRAAVAERKRWIAENIEKKKAYRQGYFVCKHMANADQSQIDVPETSIHFIETSNTDGNDAGFIKIFKDPEAGHPYVVTCDPNMGGKDDVAMQVVDNYTGEQVARFKSNALANDLCAWQLYCLGRYYNWALVSSETNVGQIVMELLVRAKYPRIYVTQAQNYQNYTRNITRQYGHKTTVANRQYMIDSFVKAFRENPSMISDYDTICEMESFQLVEHLDKDGNVTRAKQEAAGGAHDDLVMAMAAFYLVRTQQSAIVDEQEQQAPREETLQDINMRIMRERKENEQNSHIAERSIGITW